MQNSYLADFYHGWIIEIVEEQDGLRTTCYSPSRERFSEYATHTSDFQALRNAKRVINRYVTRNVLASFLRDMYEREQLSFDEWRSLNQSLSQTITAVSGS